MPEEKECEGKGYETPVPEKKWAEQVETTARMPVGWDPLRAQAMGMTPQKLWQMEYGSKQDPFTAHRPAFPDSDKGRGGR